MHVALLCYRKMAAIVNYQLEYTMVTVTIVRYTMHELFRYKTLNSGCVTVARSVVAILYL